LVIVLGEQFNLPMISLLDLPIFKNFIIDLVCGFLSNTILSSLKPTFLPNFPSIYFLSKPKLKQMIEDIVFATLEEQDDLNEIIESLTTR